MGAASSESVMGAQGKGDQPRPRAELQPTAPRGGLAKGAGACHAWPAWGPHLKPSPGSSSPGRMTRLSSPRSRPRPVYKPYLPRASSDGS